MGSLVTRKHCSWGILGICRERADIFQFSTVMRVHKIERRQFIGMHPEDVFSFFSQAENLQEITPGWLNFQILSVKPPELRKGALIEYRLAWHGLIPIRWATKITRWEPPHAFVDEQIAGPYRLWHHEHRFVAQGTGTVMFDMVKYSMPLGLLGAIAHRILVRRDVQAIFDFREKRIRERFS